MRELRERLTPAPRGSARAFGADRGDGRSGVGGCRARSVGRCTTRNLGAVYGGSSTGDDPLALQVSSDHRRLVRALVHVTADCSDGGALLWSGQMSFVGKLPSQIAASRSLLTPNKLPGSGAFAARMAWARMAMPPRTASQGSWSIGDDLTDFPLGSGSFGDTFDMGPFNERDGTKTNVHYVVSGTVGKTSASGTYAVT